jgi:hypothetical protein
MTKRSHSARILSDSSPRLQGQLLCVLALACATSFFISCGGQQAPQAGQGGTEEERLRQKIALLTRQDQVLTTELALAKTASPYLAIDVANRKMELKVQGHALRSFAIAKLTRIGGEPFVTQTWIETEAKPLEITARGRMIPGSGESTTASTAAKDPWGPKRMPADYDLLCKGGQALEIRSLASEQTHSRATRWIVSGYRQARDWFRDRWGSNKTNYKESLEIWLSEDDAKLLFWSLPKQLGILLLNAS